LFERKDVDWEDVACSEFCTDIRWARIDTNSAVHYAAELKHDYKGEIVAFDEVRGQNYGVGYQPTAMGDVEVGIFSELATLRWFHHRLERHSLTWVPD
jgi:hypothetical protein